MKFDARKGDKGRVTDADGLRIPYPIHGDTETGVVECYAVDWLGKLIEPPQHVVMKYKAPLTIKDFHREPKP